MTASSTWAPAPATWRSPRRELVGPEGAAVGIDASPEMVERARLLAARKASAAEYVVASAASLPFEDDSFDVVVSRLVLHHLTGDLKTQALR